MGGVDQNGKVYFIFGFDSPLRTVLTTSADAREKLPTDQQDLYRNFQEQLKSVVRDAEPKHFEFVQGRRRMRCSLYPLPAGILPLPGAIWNTTDIEDLARFEDDLKERVRLQELTVNAFDRAVIITNEKGQIKACNPVFRTLFRLGSELLEGRNLNELFQFRSESAGEQTFNPLAGVKLQKKPQAFAPDLQMRF